MSSHHIIRENQEPALLVIDVDAIAEDSLGQLLEWSPIVLTIDKNVDFFLSRGIKIDVVFTIDQDLQVQQDGTIVLPIQQHVVVDALQYLQHKNQFDLHLLWNEYAVELLMDHTAEFTFAVYSHCFKYIFQTSFQKWMPQYAAIKIITGMEDYTTENLQLLHENEYHVIADGFVNIYSNSGKSLIIGERL